MPQVVAIHSISQFCSLPGIGRSTHLLSTNQTHRRAAPLIVLPLVFLSFSTASPPLTAERPPWAGSHPPLRKVTSCLQFVRCNGHVSMNSASAGLVAIPWKISRTPHSSPVFLPGPSSVPMPATPPLYKDHKCRRFWNLVSWNLVSVAPHPHPRCTHQFPWT